MMVSTQKSDHRMYSDEIPFPTPDYALARFKPEQPGPALTDNKSMKTATSTSASAHSTYQSACYGLPDQLQEAQKDPAPLIPEKSVEQPATDDKERPENEAEKMPAVVTASTRQIADTEQENLVCDGGDGGEEVPEAVPKVSGRPVQDDREEGVSPAGESPSATMQKIGLTLSQETRYDGPFDRLQRAYSRIVDPIPHNSLENFPTWLYLFSSASSEAQQDAVFNAQAAELHEYPLELPVGFPSLPVTGRKFQFFGRFIFLRI
jgi:hypothetical protein